jgi:thiol-disulfide isomerase/thioredoxin
LSFNLEKVMTRIFLIIVFVLTWVIAHGQERRNVIRGEVEGLEAGDRVILSVRDPGGSLATWLATDSTVVSKAGEFTLETRVTGSYAALTRLKAGETFDPIGEDYAGCFLEGYAELRVTGNVEEWDYMKKSGGLYAHPDMQRLIHFADSSLALNREMVALGNRIVETQDARLVTAFNELKKQYHVVRQDKDLLEREFRETHPGMAYSAHLLWTDYSVIIQGMDKYEEAFLALAPAVQASPAGRLVHDHIATARASGVGVVAPDFTLADMNGREITLSAFRGKHVLLDFWGSRCGPCRAQSNPELVKLYAAVLAKGADIEIIGIACTERNDEEWLQAIKKDNLTWTQLNDAHSGKSKSLEKQYAIMGLPTSVLISPEGIIMDRDFTFPDYSFHVVPKVKELFGL